VRRVVVAYNVDFEESSPQHDAGHAARKDVADVARAVADALAGTFDVALVPVDADLHGFCERVKELAPVAVFNLCESIAGDARLESAVPMLLEAMGVPYTGSPPAALALALRKDRVKTVLLRARVPTPAGGLFAALPARLTLPCIVKPSREDGSAGIGPASVARTTAAVRKRALAVERTFRQPALVEEYVDGRELVVALLGGRALPPWEIDFSRMPASLPRIVTYTSKWQPGSVEDVGARPRRARLPGPLLARVRRVASAAFAAVGLRDYGRVDLRLDAAGNPWVVDVNPNCDLSPSAGFARAAAAAGVPYPILVRRLVALALRRTPRTRRT
jgi:D-alanine-D-alanine ligase